MITRSIFVASLLLASAVVARQEARVKGVIEPPQPSAAVSVLHGITAAVKGTIVREARGAEDYGQGGSLGGSKSSVSAGVGGKAHSEGGYSGKHIVPGDPVKWSPSRNYPPDTGFSRSTACGSSCNDQQNDVGGGVSSRDFSSEDQGGFRGGDK